MLNDRLAQLADYPFARLRALLDPLPPPPKSLALSLGEPQHAPPELIDDALAMAKGQWRQYPAVEGIDLLRHAACDWLSRRFGLPGATLDAEKAILPLAGSREGLFLTALLAVPPRKNGQIPAVLMPNPYYAVYEGAARLAGGEPVGLAATAASGFLPNLDALSPELLNRTALFYLCSPSNPQGAVASLAYWQRLITLARQYDFVIASDECYTELYLDSPVPSILNASALMDGQALDRVLSFHSLSKRSNAAGLRSGFVYGDPHYIAGFTRLRSYAAAGTPLPLQYAAAALWQDDAHVAANRLAYQQKFALAETIFSNHFGYTRPGGGFFLWLDVGDGEASARKLWQEEGLRVLPGAYIAQTLADGTNPGRAYIRVALLHDLATLGPALERLCACLER
jgi:N-succinyldiaminopimelate aminotransferase